MSEEKKIYTCTCGAAKLIRTEDMCVCCGGWGWHGSCIKDEEELE